VNQEDPMEELMEGVEDGAMPEGMEDSEGKFKAEAGDWGETGEETPKVTMDEDPMEDLMEDA